MLRAKSSRHANELHRVLILLAVAAIIVLLSEAGCESAKSGVEGVPGPSLNDRFVANVLAGGRRTEGGGSFTPHFKVVRNGAARDAMVLEAPVAIRMPLRGVGRGAVLECLSTPVFNIGDGLQMDVLLAQDGRGRVVYSRYYDPGRKLEDRAWIPLSIPLGLDATEDDAELEIRVSGGPQGDLVADWLALSAVHIVQNPRQQ